VAFHIVVTAKQVMDPETPLSAFHIDPNANRVEQPINISPVVNGYDEQAVEAALRIKDITPDTRITVLSVGPAFAMDVIKKPLAMGADSLVLIQGTEFENTIDPTLVVKALAAAIQKLGDVDLVISGRQASDWDNAQVPLGLAETLGWAVATIGRKVDVEGQTVTIQRVLPDGHEVVEATLPAVVTVSNELGAARYPNMRGIMAAKRIEPTIWTATDLGVDTTLTNLQILTLGIPEQTMVTEIIEGDDDADAGRKLALRLREEKLI
jgi:electron transfer flavoprotein beta subunit